MRTLYSGERIAQTRDLIERRQPGRYGQVDLWLYEALAKHPIHDKDTLVFGSCEQGFGPWYEYMAVFFGAKRPIHVCDVNDIYYELDECRRLAPFELDQYKYRAILSISSFEHFGLGRYGDPIDSDGDIRAMHKCKQLLNTRGKLFLAVPLGLDKIHTPWHRIYGRERFPRLIEGWEILDSFGFSEGLLDVDTGFGWNKDSDLPEMSPVLVLQPKGGVP